MKFPKVALLVAVAVATFVLPFAYAIRLGVKEGGKWLDSSFMQGAVGNLLATVIGVAVGMPVALWVNRVAQQNASREEDVRTAKEKAGNEKTALGILMRELKDNEPGLISATQGVITQFHYFTGRWEAIVGAGGIRSIRNPEVVAAIAHTYERIEALNQLAVHWLATLTAGERYPHTSGPAEIAGETSLKRLVVAAANESIQHVRVTLPIMTARMKTLSSEL